MTTICKTWLRDEDIFNPLCSQTFDPKTGTDECPICVSPVALSPPANCGGCTGVLFPAMYKIKTPFKMSGAAGSGGSETIISGKYTSTATVWNAGYGWDDAKELWESPLVRLESGLGSPCGKPTCNWVTSKEKIVFALFSGWGLFTIPGQPFRSKPPIVESVGSSGTVKFPQRLRTWTGISGAEFTPCSIMACDASSLNRDNSESFLTYGQTLSSSYAAITIPDIAKTWPSGYGSLSDKPVAKGTAGLVSGPTGLRYYNDLPNSGSNSKIGNGRIAHVGISLTANQQGIFTLQLRTNSITSPIDLGGQQGWGQSFTTGTISENKRISNAHFAVTTLFDSTLNRFVGSSYDQLFPRPVLHSVFWNDPNAPRSVTYTGAISCGNPDRIVMHMVSTDFEPLPVQYYPDTIILEKA